MCNRKVYILFVDCNSFGQTQATIPNLWSAWKTWAFLKNHLNWSQTLKKTDTTITNALVFLESSTLLVITSVYTLQPLLCYSEKKYPNKQDIFYGSLSLRAHGNFCFNWLKVSTCLPSNFIYYHVFFISISCNESFWLMHAIYANWTHPPKLVSKIQTKQRIKENFLKVYQHCLLNKV